MSQNSKIKNIEIGDFLSYRVEDNNYRVILCISTQITKSPFSFGFAVLTINQQKKPTKTDLLNSGFYGIVNRKKLYHKTKENSNSIMWKDHHPEINPFLIGAYTLLIWRKEFMRFREYFEFVVNIPIIKNLDLTGSGTMVATDKESLDKIFLSNIDEVMGERRQKAIVIPSILIGNEKLSKL